MTALEPHICFEDEHLLVINKPAGMPTQPDPTGDLSLLKWLTKPRGAAATLHLVNRLDRPVSGLVVLAKTRQAMAYVQQLFREGRVKKEYLAAVEGAPPEEEGKLVHFLTQNPKTHRAYVHFSAQPNAVRAALHYRLLGKGERYSFLLVQPTTGRHHQIRAQLAAMGCPIKGDVRYGARRANRDRSIHLHAWRLTLEHPATHQPLSIRAPLPQTDGLWREMAGKIPQ